MAISLGTALGNVVVPEELAAQYLHDLAKTYAGTALGDALFEASTTLPGGSTVAEASEPQQEV